LTETTVKEDWGGEFRERIYKQVQWHTIPIKVANVPDSPVLVNLPLIIEFDIRKILEDCKKELGSDLLVVVDSFKNPQRAITPEVKKLAEDFTKWFGPLNEL